MAQPDIVFKLDTQPSETGLCCEPDGLTLAGVPLLRRTTRGFEPCAPHELRAIFKIAYGDALNIDTETCRRGLWVIARALDDSDLPYAMIASVLLKLPELDDERADLLKANFNPMQARANDGRWTDEGDGASFVPAQIAIPAPPPGPPGVGKPAFPWNTPNPPWLDELIHPFAGSRTRPTLSDDTGENTRAEAETKDRPKLCPPETPEKPDPTRTLRARLYQSQISQLRLDYDVELNGVRFDGCRNEDGTMLEAKGPGLEWMVKVKRRDWLYTESDLYERTMKQARKQVAAAGDRRLEWHFSDKDLADFFREEFARAGLTKIIVIYTPAKVTKGLLPLWGMVSPADSIFPDFQFYPNTPTSELGAFR